MWHKNAFVLKSERSRSLNSSSLSLNRRRSPRDEVGQLPLADPLQRLVHLESKHSNVCNLAYCIADIISTVFIGNCDLHLVTRTSDIVTIFPIPKANFSTVSLYCLVTTCLCIYWILRLFCPRPEVVTISDKDCTISTTI